MRTKHLLVVSALLASIGAEARADALVARAIEVEGQRVTIDVGREDGVVVGDHVAFSVIATTDLGDGELAEAEYPVAVGEVTASSSHRARVRLGLNERVEPGTRAVLTDAALSRSQIAPLPSSARTTLVIGMRAVSAVHARGGGVLVDARLDRRIGSRIVLRLRMDPTGIVGFRFPDPDREGPEPRPARSFAAAASLVGLIAYDGGLVELGAGLGVTMTTRIDERHLPCAGCEAVETHHGFEPGLTFATTARFGPRDGLSLEVDTAFVALRSRIEASRFAARLHVPVTPSLAFVASGSGGFGIAGTRIVELGARMLVRGNGHGGTLFVTPTLGYVALAERARLDTTLHGQPRPSHPVLVHGLAAGVSIERRF